MNNVLSVLRAGFALKEDHVGISESYIPEFQGKLGVSNAGVLEVPSRPSAAWVPMMLSEPFLQCNVDGGLPALSGCPECIYDLWRQADW